MSRFSKVSAADTPTMIHRGMRQASHPNSRFSIVDRPQASQEGECCKCCSTWFRISSRSRHSTAHVRLSGSRRAVDRPLGCPRILGQELGLPRSWDAPRQTRLFCTALHALKPTWVAPSLPSRASSSRGSAVLRLLRSRALKISGVDSPTCKQGFVCVMSRQPFLQKVRVLSREWTAPLQETYYVCMCARPSRSKRCSGICICRVHPPKGL